MWPVSEPLLPVTYAAPGALPEAQHGTTSAFGFEATILRLKAALQAEDLWLIHEIDPQMIVKRGGYRIEAIRQLLFFHPRFMVRVLERDLNALVEVPLKLVILRLPDGSISVRHPDVLPIFAHYPGLEPLAAELDAIYARLRNAVA